MRLKISLRSGGMMTDLEVVAEADATVGDVAVWLARSVPANRTERMSAPIAVTLRVADTGAPDAVRELDPEAPIGEAGLRSGAVVELAAVQPERFRAAGSDHGPAAAVLRVLSGPEAGREHPLPFGASTVGRDRGVDVRLTDTLVSRRHARINVGDTIEIVDLNSANGVLVGGAPAARATLSPADQVTLGDTSFCLVPLQGVRGTSGGGSTVGHIRSPRVVPRYPGHEFEAPTPPRPPQRQRFPYLALVAPLLMGAVLYALTQQILGVAMMAMSPLLLVGGYVDQSLAGRRSRRADRKRFDAAMLQLQDRLEQARGDERRARAQEMPGTAELVEASQKLGPLLWSERPEHSTFLAVNLGLGRAPSRNLVVLPSSNDTEPEYWDQLLQLQAEFAAVDRVPVVAELRSCGAFGVAGPTEERHPVACGLAFQLLTRHSPAELVVAAIVPPAARQQWGWLKWMPHATSAHSPLEGQTLADSAATASALLAQLEGLVEARLAGASGPTPTPRGPIDATRGAEVGPTALPGVLLVVEHGAPVDQGRLTRLAERGADGGVHVLWCAPSLEMIPAACRSHLSIARAGTGAVVGQVRSGETTMPVEAERLDPARAEALARTLASVVDVGAPEEDDSDLPRHVSYAALAGPELLEESELVIERWRENGSLLPRDGSQPKRGREGSLRALVGHAGTEPFYLDLRRDGPHALVGGTTGSGKSEFLQSWVLGMAAANSPDRLTFLFVDYKGGSAFADCVHLPHVVGLVTDLSPHLVRRALTSLRAEIQYRERLLERKKMKDLLSLERSGDPECPPSLVIVVDEFAALVQEVPEFVDGVVDVAQRGRSLGLHLILATQRPAGVIKDNLRANTNLRIALRTADVEDSADILGSSLAAHFDPGIPGRAAAKSGPGRIRPFQTAYAGGRTTSEVPPPEIEVRELGFGATARWEPPPAEAAEDGHLEGGPSDITRIVNTIAAAATAAEVPQPRKPWRETLASVYSFQKLPKPRTDEKIPLGVVDQPQTQDQPPAFYEPDVHGNIAILGTGGSGKSTALRTIAAAAAITTRGGQAHVYALDFGAGGLRMLESLPHVAAVVPGDDEERVIRVLRRLRDTVDDRAIRYAAVNASTIGEYRRLADAPEEPRIFLLIDGVGAFRDSYEFGSAQNSSWFTAFAQIAADGRQLGVHVVMTADRPSSVPSSISATVQRRIVLRLASDDDYALLGLPKDILGPASPPGRAILDGNEMQFAVFGDSPNLAIQARELQQLAADMGRGGANRPEPIATLPEQVALDMLPKTVGRRTVIGVDDMTLGPAAIELRGSFLLSGPPSSGKTTTLATLAAAARRSSPEMSSVVLAPRPSPITRRPGWSEHADRPDLVAALSARLYERIETTGESAPRMAIFIENVTDFHQGEAEQDLDRLIRLAVRNGHFVVGEAETSTWSQAWTLAAPFKAGRRGILLTPGDMDGDLLGAPLGRIRRSDFPPGRGFVIAAGRAAKLQIAEPAGTPEW